MEVSRAKKTLPRFILTNYRDLTIRRYSGEYVFGEWQSNIEEEFTIQGNIQPMKPTEIMLMPESERTREWVKVYLARPDETLINPRTAKEGEEYMADRLIWENGEYEVMKEKHYRMAVLDSTVLYCARIPISAL